MHHIFQKFIDLLSNAGDAEAFAETMATTAGELELSCFAYLALPHRLSKEPLIISTYPTNWVAHYLRNRYERVDPIITRALHSPEPFSWGSDLSSSHISLAQQLFLNEASEFGIPPRVYCPRSRWAWPGCCTNLCHGPKATEVRTVHQHARARPSTHGNVLPRSCST